MNPAPNDADAVLLTETPAAPELSTTRPRRARSVLRFTAHYLEMVLAMTVGMVALGPVWYLAWPGLMDQPTLGVLVMATDMSVAMALWMRLRGHDWTGIGWMVAAMYLPFALALPPYWAGLLSEAGMMTAGHVLMLPLMALVMLGRPHAHRS